MLIEGGRNDLFVVRLRENSGAGYLWNFDQLRDAGFALVDDDREEDNPDAIGGVLTRKVTARSEDRVQGEVLLQEARPWMADVPLHELSLRYDLRGPESPGMWEPELKRGAAGGVGMIKSLVDLRGDFGPARDQDPRPTCMAFAASDAHAAARDGWEPLSTEWAYYHALKRDGGLPHEGTTIGRHAGDHQIRWSASRGRVALHQSAITDVKSWKPPARAKQLFFRDHNACPVTVQDIIDQLHAGTPVLITMTLSDAFYRPDADGIVERNEPMDPKRHHAVVAVGHGQRGCSRFCADPKFMGRGVGSEGPRLDCRRLFEAPAHWSRDNDYGAIDVMYTPIPPQPTNAQAWLAAASAVQDAGGEAYNVVIDIADPLAVTGPDDAILTTVDQFLREHHVNTLSGVANTIFPQRSARSSWRGRSLRRLQQGAAAHEANDARLGALFRAHDRLEKGEGKGRNHHQPAR